MVAPRPSPIRAALLSAVLVLLPGCEFLSENLDTPCGQVTEVGESNGRLLLRADLKAGQTCQWPFVFGRDNDEAGTVVEITERYDPAKTASTMKMDGFAEDEPGWIGPRIYLRGGHVLTVTATEAVSVDILVHLQGDPAVPTYPLSVFIDDVNYVQSSWFSGMPGMLELMSDDGHGGRLLEQWLTAFSQGDGARTGPGQLLTRLRENGDDASKWPLAQLPFRGVSLDNRIDLMDDKTCGEVQVVVTTTAVDLDKMNFLFRFVQPPQNGDVSPGGRVHCMQTAREWASLVRPGLTDEVDLINERLTKVFNRLNFKSVQTSEAIGTAGDWQFREWKRVPNTDAATVGKLPYVLAPIALSQTVDIGAVNTAGTLRDDFLAYVSANATDLTARRSVIPAKYLPTFQHLQEFAWNNHTNEKIDLTGVDTAILDANPTLRQSMEVVGCSGCHGAVETVVHAVSSGEGGGLNASAFFREELQQRLALLVKLQKEPIARPAYGPLQPSVLPPQ